MRAAGEVGVSNKGSYRGYALQLVDEKGRVAIPSPLRAALLARSPRDDDGKPSTSVVLQVHERHRCICGFDLDTAEEREAALEARALQNSGEGGAPDDNILRAGMASESTSFDSSGRFVMPGFPRKRARIGQWAFFFGMGSYFEIWDPATLLATDGIPDSVKELVEYELEQRGVTL